MIQRLDLAAAWKRLSAGEQETLSLRIFEDLASPQAARVLGISSASYRLRLLRARRALRRELDLVERAPSPPGSSPAAADHTSAASPSTSTQLEMLP